MKEYGLFKKERLRKSKEIQKILKKGKKYYCDGAILFVLSNNLSFSRIGFTFRKKYGTAVKRNYSKRLSREVFRLNKNRIKIGYDLVLLSFPGKETYLEKEEQFITLLNKANLLLKKL